MTTEFLTRDHVRNKFRKLPLKAIRPEHLQTAARKRYGNRSNDVVISHGDEHIVLILSDLYIVDDVDGVERHVNSLVQAARTRTETLAGVRAALAESQASRDL